MHMLNWWYCWSVTHVCLASDDVFGDICISGPIKYYWSLTGSAQLIFSLLAHIVISADIAEKSIDLCFHRYESRLHVTAQSPEQSIQTIKRKIIKVKVGCITDKTNHSWLLLTELSEQQSTEVSYTRQLHSLLCGKLKDTLVILRPTWLKHRIHFMCTLFNHKTDSATTTAVWAN